MIRKIQTQSSENHYYRAFGLNIISDLAFPELLPLDTEETQAIDVEIRYIEKLTEKEYSSNYYHLAHGDVGDFAIENGNRISYTPAEEATEDALRLFILGSSMGALLQQRGYVVLHGNAVSTDGQYCDIYVGHSGAGKSTLASWHYLQGTHILADDVCAITFDADNQAYVIPSYPQLKLWQTSADLLGIDTSKLRRIHNRMTKFAIPVREQFFKQPLPLRSVTEIFPDAEKPRIMTGLNKITTLIENSYRYYFLKAMGLEKAYQEKILTLAGVVECEQAPRKSFETLK